MKASVPDRNEIRILEALLGCFQTEIDFVLYLGSLRGSTITEKKKNKTGINAISSGAEVMLLAEHHLRRISSRKKIRTWRQASNKVLMKLMFFWQNIID